jgi:hypothetical protein
MTEVLAPPKLAGVISTSTLTLLHHLRRKSTRVKLSSTKSKSKIGTKQKKMKLRLRRMS